ncbi:MAG TPA: RluA family pseudouridine synthase [Bryobacterales bacterium]|nr:RluA family pseudouridine synthase [Bryobacterales bacterium]
MTFQVPPQDAGLRLDQFLARQRGEVSRARIQHWIRSGLVRVDGAAARPSARLRGGERVELPSDVPAPPLHAFAEPIPLDVLYEDDDLVAIHKPAGMTVHAGAGAHQGTLVNALLGRFERLSQVGGALRPGLVHRLDRLTSGVLLVAKNDAAHLGLARQFATREVRKAYIALVHGSLAPRPARPGRGQPVVIDGLQWTRLEMPIRRDPRHRVKMTAKAKEGRSALTDFRLLEQWPGFALLEVRIATGRTHQIRVHLAAIGHPVVGDTLYGAPAQPSLPRLFLHARQIVFHHPTTGQTVRVEAPLPAALEQHLAALRAGHPRLVLL